MPGQYPVICQYSIPLLPVQYPVIARTVSRYLPVQDPVIARIVSRYCQDTVPLLPGQCPVIASTTVACYCHYYSSLLLPIVCFVLRSAERHQCIASPQQSLLPQHARGAQGCCLHLFRHELFMVWWIQVKRFAHDTLYC